MSLRMKYNAAVVQMMISHPDKSENLKRALGFLEEAARRGARVVCFPDYFLTDTPTRAHTPDDIQRLAETIPGPATRELSTKAKEMQIFVVAGSLIEKGEDGKLYSTCPFIGPDGELIGKVRKAHPENAPPKYEVGSGITPGPGDYTVFDTKIGKVGIMIDMDGATVEVPRILSLKGAEIIFWPVNFSARFMGGVHLASRYYSTFAASAYIATASRVGWHKNVPVHGWAYLTMEPRMDLMYGGGSGIAFGETYIAAVPDFSEGIAIGAIDTDLVSKVRRHESEIYPFRRRPETYGALTEKEKT